MILSIDQSTAQTKVFIFDEHAKIVGKSNIAHKQYYPNEGYVEHDANEIYSNTILAIDLALKNSNLSIIDISAISISNQRETIVAWDKLTGNPVYNAIVWQCNRGKDICSHLEKGGYAPIIKEKTGLILSPFFSASKLSWIMKNVKDARKLAEEHRLLCGTIDSFLIFKLTDGKCHFTDFSNASRTQLFNINTLKWDEEILDLFEIPHNILPEVKFSDEIFGFFKLDGANVPITGVLGDSHAAFFGQNCFNKGNVKATYGTGSSIMMNIGNKPLKNDNGIVTSIGYGFKNSITYVFEGNINSTGATIKWLEDNMEMVKLEEVEKIASTVSSSLGVYMIPAFTGLGAPHWDNDARGIITGLTFGTKKAHVVRAALESIAYQINDVILAMTDSIDDPFLGEIRVDGGPTKNNLLMQFQTDILRKDVAINKTSELSALGSALMAYLAINVFKDLDSIIKLRETKERFSPKMDESTRYELCKGWKSAIAKACTK